MAARAQAVSAQKHLQWYSENLQEPAECDLLQVGGAGRGAVEAGILIPGGGEPVGRERDGQRATDDKAEEAPAGHGRRRG